LRRAWQARGSTRGVAHEGCGSPGAEARHQGHRGFELRITFFHVYNTLEDVQAVLQVLEEKLGLLAAMKSIWGVMSQP
jgi:hypothetical protein